jgi:hypothetical protein
MARDYSNNRYSNVRSGTCGCPAGAKKVPYKNKKGFTCMAPVSNAPRFVKKLANGSCPAGAKKTKNGGCLSRGSGMRIVRKVCR